MLNLGPLQDAALTFVVSATGIGLAGLIKSYFFKKKITSQDVYIALYMLIALPLASFFRVRYAMNTVSWKGFWLYVVAFGVAQLLAQLGRWLFDKYVNRLK